MRYSVCDVKAETCALWFLSGKGRKPGVTFLGARSRRDLMRYLRFRGEIADADPLFAPENGGRPGYSALWDVTRRRAQDAGIDALSFLACRRGIALDSLRNGADVYSVQKMMGHTRLNVTRRYLWQTPDDPQRVHEEAGPVDRML